MSPLVLVSSLFPPFHSFVCVREYKRSVVDSSLFLLLLLSATSITASRLHARAYPPSFFLFFLYTTSSSLPPCFLDSIFYSLSFLFLLLMPQQQQQQQQQRQQQQQQPVAVYSSLSDSHTSRDIQHPPQQDQLWKIIEKQRVLIQGLQKSNAILAAERDGLRDRIVHLEQRLASSNKGETGEDVSGPGSMTCYSPTPPPRSPYRASNSNNKHNDDSHQQHPYHHNADNTTTTSRGISPPPPPPPFDRRPSTPASPPPAPSTPTSPQTIIEKDAQLYAQYQMSIQRKESSHYNNNNRPTPSKSTDTATSSSYYHRPELGKWSSSAVDVSSNGVHKINNSRSNINDNTTTTSSWWSPSPSNSNDDHSSSSSPAAAAAAGGEAPLRLAKLMDDVIVKVVGSNIKRNEKGREVVSFIISVGKRGAADTYEELWRVEKLYSDILALDTKVN